MALDTSTESWTVRPRWATERNLDRPTYGPAVAAVAESFGTPLMPHQRLVLDVALEVQSEAAGDPFPGAFAYRTVVDLEQRRAGKTVKLAPAVAHLARRRPGASMWMTAQNGKTAVKRWRDVAQALKRSPLRHDVKLKISHTFEELRWLREDSTLVPFAPNEDGLHSETPDLVMVDELWAFSAEDRRKVQAGYVPAMGTTDGQVWLLSAAGTEKSSWLNDERRAGRASVEAGERFGRAFFEWGLPDVVDGRPVDDLSDLELVAACIAWHPAVCHVPSCPGAGPGIPCSHGFTLPAASIEQDWTNMADRAEFVRAWGNRTAADSSDRWQALEEEIYLRQIDRGGIPEDASPSFGIYVDPDSKDAAVSAGWRDPAGRMHVEVIRHAAGTRWVAPWVAGANDRQKPPVVAIPNVAGCRDVADQLEKLGVPVIRVPQADYSAASTRHRDELASGTWWHRFHKEALAGAGAAGWGTGWARLRDPISAHASSTLAGWAHDHAPERARFWIG